MFQLQVFLEKPTYHQTEYNKKMVEVKRPNGLKTYWLYQIYNIDLTS